MKVPFRILLLLTLGVVSPAVSPAQVPGGRVYALDVTILQKSRERALNGDNALTPALKRLRNDADKLLRETPVSVMEKTQVPPSGDKHDYFSLGRYYWPDPSKPDGLPYISRDGEVNPEIDGITDNRNLGRMAGSSWRLALAYYFTGEETYAEHAAKFIRTWFLDSATAMNPNFEYSQGVKGASTGRPSGLIDSRDFYRVVDAIGLISTSHAWSPSDQDGMMRWFGRYLAWLLESSHGVKESRATNNHGVWYDVQAVSIALFVGKTDVARSILERAKAERIGRQIEPDGSQPRELARTLSKHYTRFNLEAFVMLASLGRSAGVDLWNYQTADGRSIRAALNWYTPYLRGDKEWQWKQIKPFVRADCYPIYVRAAAAYQDDALLDIAHRVSDDKSASDVVHLLSGK